MERKPISKKIRFDVFKRDMFTCQYCNQSTPKVVLEIDHIIPISKGGKNNIDNLVTACFDCNRGKGANELTVLPETIEEKRTKLQLRQEQYKSYEKLLKATEDTLNKEVDKIQIVYNNYYPNSTFNDKFRVSIKNFIKKLGFGEVKISIEDAISRTQDIDHCLNYFCAICWRKIKNPL